MAEPHILFTVVLGVLVGSPAAKRRLAGRGLSQARREDAAHDHFVNFRWLHARVGHGRLDGDGAELRRGDRGKSTLKGAHRRSPSAQNDDRIRFHSVGSVRDDELNIIAAQGVFKAPTGPLRPGQSVRGS